ncbi:MAG: hypothetical protein QW370_06075 [Ignisphaera sp.]
MRVLLLNKIALVFLVVALTLTAYVATEPVADIASRYYGVEFSRFYSYEYIRVTEILTRAIDGPLPIISRGLTSSTTFNNLLQLTSDKYPIISNVYRGIIIGDAINRFYTFSFPTAIIFSSIFYVVVLDAMSIRRILQVIASIGIRRYWFNIVILALMSSLAYVATLALPVSLYVCPSCSLWGKFVGFFSLFTLFSIVLLSEALVYVLVWNALPALLVGMSTSIVFLSYPEQVAEILKDSIRLFGLEVQDPISVHTLLNLVFLLLLFLATYVVIVKREVY